MDDKRRCKCGKAWVRFPCCPRKPARGRAYGPWGTNPSYAKEFNDRIKCYGQIHYFEEGAVHLHWQPPNWATTACGVNLMVKTHYQTTPVKSDATCKRCLSAPIVATAAEVGKRRFPLDIA